MALRGQGEIRPELAARLRRLAAEAGYSPRLAAQHLRAGRTGQVGLVMAMRDARSAFGAPSLSSMLGAVVWECDRARRRYVLEFTTRDAEAFEPPSQVTGQAVDGTILIGDTGDRLRQWLAAREGFPWISIEEPAPYAVVGRMDTGIAGAVDRLHALGHRLIAYAGGPQEYQTHRLGLEGFERARSGHGLSNAAGWVQHFPISIGAETVALSYAWACSLLERALRPTAIVCHGDVLARNAILAASESRLRVPRDLSVISCGPASIAHQYHPRLTTVELDYAAMAREAMAMWCDLTDGRPVAEPCRWVATRMMDGETIGPALRAGHDARMCGPRSRRLPVH
jgi:DNA-binding LacI/PurR family transcriptional regulator